MPSSRSRFPQAPTPGATRRIALALVTVLALATALAACGAGGPQKPSIGAFPLIDGARVTAQAQVCDRGANAFCAIHLVVVDPRFKSSNELLAAERLNLRRHGWTAASGETSDQRAADSPGHKLRATYATAYGDLKGIDRDWIKRPRSIELALSRTMFDRSSAISVMLEVGPG
jgi:hypothetical protein